MAYIPQNDGQDNIRKPFVEAHMAAIKAGFEAYMQAGEPEADSETGRALNEKFQSDLRQTMEMDYPKLKEQQREAANGT